jgi:RES domain-containing protein
VKRRSRPIAATLPPTSRLHRRNTHRLIPSKYSATDPLEEIAESPTQLGHLAALSNSTDEILLAESGALPAIDPHELASGVAHARMINAAFVYAHPLGSRFNSADRGAWYAAFQLSTAQAEVAFHKTVHLAEVGRYEDEVELDDYLADFDGQFHDLRRAKRFAACLDPSSYVASQTLAERLLESGSTGVVYPSVRRARGTCLACFDPKKVANVRKAERFRFVWHGRPAPRIIRVSARARRSLATDPHR